jgi:hypothetical protein
VGQITDGLNNPFKNAVFKFIQKQCKQTGDRKPKNYPIYINEKGISDKPFYKKAVQKLAEMLESDPTGTPDTPSGPVILKGDYHPVHGKIGKKNIKYNHRQHHDDEHLIPFDIL